MFRQVGKWLLTVPLELLTMFKIFVYAQNHKQKNCDGNPNVGCIFNVVIHKTGSFLNKTSIKHHFVI